MDSLAELNATIEKAFHEFDRDGNGTISKEELKMLIERFEGTTIDNDELDELFRELDKDNSNVIEYSEFYSWFTSKSSTNKRLKRIANLSKKLFHVDSFTAAWNGDIKTVKKFIDSSADINASYETLFGRKNTMLHYAAYEGHFYICKMLIESGADKYSSNTMRCTPFHYACQQDQHKIVKYFLKNDDVNINNIFIPDLEGNSAINVAGPKCRSLLKEKYTFPENNLTIIHNKKFESQSKIEIYLYIQLNVFECFDSINIEIFKKEKNGSWTSVLKTLYSYSDYIQKDRLYECESKVPIDDSTYQLSFGKKYYNLKFDAIPAVRYKCVASVNDFPPVSNIASDSDKENNEDDEEDEFEKDTDNNDGLDDSIGESDVEIKKSDDVIYGENEILCCKCVPVKVNIVKLIDPPEEQKLAPFKWTVVFEYTPCICGSPLSHFIIEYRPISGSTYEQMKVELKDNNNLVEEKEDEGKEEDEGKINERNIKRYGFSFTSKSKRIYVRMKAINRVGDGPISDDFPKPVGFVATTNTSSSNNRRSNNSRGGSGNGGSRACAAVSRRSSNQSKVSSTHSTQSKTLVHSRRSNNESPPPPLSAVLSEAQQQQQQQEEEQNNEEESESKRNSKTTAIRPVDTSDALPVETEENTGIEEDADVEKTLIIEKI